jgi:hypothetical protein
MARLTEAVEGLVASLQAAQSELEWVASRLEDEFSTRYNGGEINALDLLARIHRLRRELPAVADDCSAVLEAKQACLDAAKRTLLGNTELLLKLERKAGVPAAASGVDATAAAFHAAVAEHEAKMQLHFDDAANQITRAGLNEAFVHSVMA